MVTPIATPNEEPRPWTRMDIVSAFVTFAILYALSPPWMIALARVFRAPGWAASLLSFCYHPLSIARQNLPQVDHFYDAYRAMLTPWLSGIGML